MRKFPLTAVLLLALASAAHAESFRCGKWVVTSDISVTELRKRCGAPKSMEARSEDVFARNAHGTGSYKIGERIIEVWVYARGSQAADMIVTIVDGKIRSIERAG
jgi:hypothetical protein